MEKTGKPIVAGVINIVTGVISLFALLGLIILIIAFTSPQFFADYAPELFSYEVAMGLSTCWFNNFYLSNFAVRYSIYNTYRYVQR